MTELDEIVMVAKLAWALKECDNLEEPDKREWFYLSRVGIDLRDYIPGLRERLDRKARSNEVCRRLMMETKYPSSTPTGLMK